MEPQQDIARQIPAWVPVAAALGCLIVDLKTPNGVVDGFLYVSAILLCQWLSQPRASLIMAGAVMPAMWLGFMASDTASPLWMALTNRTIAVGTVWATAIVVSRNSHRARQIALSLKQSAQRLERSNREADGDRAGIASWLREDIALELELLDRRLHRLQHASWHVVDLESEAAILRRCIKRTKDSVVIRSLRLDDRVKQRQDGPTPLQHAI